MLERLEKILKVVCAVLAALFVFQVARLVLRSNPLAQLKIPALPTLSPDTNAPAVEATNKAVAAVAPGKAGTNVAGASRGTNAPGTNVSAQAKSAKAETNATPVPVAHTSTNLPALTNALKSLTNSVAGTNLAKADTNSIAGTNSAQTNLTAKMTRKGPSGPGMPAMMGGPGGRFGGAPPPELPLPIRARVYQITDSEILGPVMRPMPMALLGIAGNVAFLRSASGQTGLVKEGDSLGSLKLLQIGINRVLVEDEGKKQELTIFSGYGSESLLPKEKEPSR